MNIIDTKIDKQGREIVFRYPEMTDASLLLDYINALSKEQTFILMQGEQLTLEQEQAFLTKQLELIQKGEGIFLVAVCNNQLAGVSNIGMHDRIQSHVGELGISVLKDFRGTGIGKLLMEVLMVEAKKKLPKLKIVELRVFGNNTVAIELYKKMGFIEYGKLPGGVQHRGVFVDDVLMSQEVKQDIS